MLVIVQYKIIHEIDFMILARKVNYCMEAGFVPLGGVAANTSGLFQAMVLYEER